MNVLKKNLNFYKRNQNIFRSLISFVRPKATDASVNKVLCRNVSIQLNFYENYARTKYNVLKIQAVQFSSDNVVTQLHYEKFCADTLDHLCDYFEELVESVNELAAADVLNKVSKNLPRMSHLLSPQRFIQFDFQDGVLTVSLGSKYGTYVINKQSPNKQIWLSSPKSGPKRFDFVYAETNTENGFWIYKHTGETLHEILDREFTEITQHQTKFQTLAFGSKC